MPPRPATVKVRRDGPKGFRLINADDFDPAVHELFDAPPAEAPPAEAPRRRGRPRKHPLPDSTTPQQEP